MQHYHLCFVILATFSLLLCDFFSDIVTLETYGDLVTRKDL